MSQKVTVDLSSDHVPDNLNEMAAGSGEDGKPGLPGFKGGNMLIISNDHICDDLKFISNGGFGGSV